MAKTRQGISKYSDKQIFRQANIHATGQDHFTWTSFEMTMWTLALLRSEIASGMCAKLRTVAASHNGDHARNLSNYCLLALHIWWCYSSRTSCSWWITQSTQHHRRVCNSIKAKRIHYLLPSSVLLRTFLFERLSCFSKNKQEITHYDCFKVKSETLYS